MARRKISVAKTKNQCDLYFYRRHKISNRMEGKYESIERFGSVKNHKYLINKRRQTKDLLIMFLRIKKPDAIWQKRFPVPLCSCFYR